MPSSYPISAVSRLTGIPLDTLRAWERRYQVVTPKRSDRGRIYSERQVQRLMLLRQAIESGHAIGQVASVSDRALRKLLDRSNALVQAVAGQKTFHHREKDFLSPVLRGVERFDYAQADRELNRLATAIASPKELIYRVALPLMRTIGERWHQGKCSIAQEHMVTALLTAMLSSYIRAFTSTNPPAKVLFATPLHEHHGFPNMAAAMLTAAGGLGVIHLGTNLPAEDVLLAARKTEASALLLSVMKTPEDEVLAQIQSIARKAPRSTALWLGGSAELGLSQATAGSRWLVLERFESLENQLCALGARF